jgi:hypothetical protein
MIGLAEASQQAVSAEDPDTLDLVCCCDENIALCGEDVREVPWSEDEERPCPICFTVEDVPCARCGCAADCGSPVHRWEDEA